MDRTLDQRRMRIAGLRQGRVFRSAVAISELNRRFADPGLGRINKAGAK